MLNICLCSDNVDIFKYYTNRILELLENRYVFNIEHFINIDNLRFELEDDANRFNIIIIDEIMNNADKIHNNRTIRSYGYDGILIVLTSNNELELNVDLLKSMRKSYILRNKDYYKFDEIFMKAALQVNKNFNNNIVISSKPYSKIINLDSVIYIKSSNKKVLLYNEYGKIEKVNCILKEIYEKVNKNGFVRCHKSYIVNLKYVKKFNKSECILKNDISIPIGRKYSKDFKNMFIEG